MVTKVIEVKMGSATEIHPAAMLVQLASGFTSSIYIEKGNRSVNAKSIMGMMTIGFSSGETLTISAAGTDEEAAVAALANYLTSEE